ncbi:MAG: prenyltransferase/squalene oxidase repeat-containing protein [Bryobacteraceae bacterium]
MDRRSEILEELRRRHPRTVEETALKELALRSELTMPSLLVSEQRPDGAWSGCSGGPPNAFVSALALIALRHTRGDTPAARRGLRWLDQTTGYENHWLWTWKFRYFDRQVRFDPAKTGWPWVPGTVSWVAPTALVLLAYSAWKHRSRRTASAVAMLLDRACPSGGWNAGNAIVFGVELDPHPDFTAMALLALRDPALKESRKVMGGLDYLARRITAVRSPYTLAWATMSLHAHRHPGASRAASLLRSRSFPWMAESTPTLALTALALEDPPFTFEEPNK